MEDFFSKEMEFLNEHDRFAKVNGMHLTVVREGYAEAVFHADDRHLNGLNIVQGGALYTFADFTFAGALNSFGFKSVGMNSASSFVRPGTGTEFKAVATLVSRGRRTAVFNTDVFDAEGRLLVHNTFTGFLSEKPFFE